MSFYKLTCAPLQHTMNMAASFATSSLQQRWRNLVFTTLQMLLTMWGHMGWLAPLTHSVAPGQFQTLLHLAVTRCGAFEDRWEKHLQKRQWNHKEFQGWMCAKCYLSTLLSIICHLHIWLWHDFLFPVCHYILIPSSLSMILIQSWSNRKWQ